MINETMKEATERYLAVKEEVRRLGGNPEMMGNIDSEGAA